MFWFLRAMGTRCFCKGFILSLVLKKNVIRKEFRIFTSFSLFSGGDVFSLSIYLSDIHFIIDTLRGDISEYFEEI